MMPSWHVKKPGWSRRQQLTHRRHRTRKQQAAAQIFHVFGVEYVPGVRFFIISTYLVLDFHHKVIK